MAATPNGHGPPTWWAAGFANFEGRLVFLTTNAKVYRHLGTPAGTGGYTLAVDGADIIANSITAGQIAAGAIGTTQLAAQSIIASKLAIADFTNRVPDNDIQDVAAWTAPGRFLVNATTAATAARSQGELRWIGTDTSGTWSSDSNYFPVAVGDELFCQYQAARSGGTNHSVDAAILFYDRAGAFISVAIIGAINTVSAGLASFENSFTVPALATNAHFRFRVYAGATDGVARFMSPSVRLKNKGELHVDGTITGNKIVANTITGGLLAASGIITVTAQFNDAVITGAKMVDATVTNAKIGSVIQSTVYNPGVTGWRISKDGTAEFKDLVVRSWLAAGAVSDEYQTIATGGFTAGTTNQVRATLDLGAINRGSILFRGAVFEWNNTGGYTLNVYLESRNKTLGGAFTPWVIIQTWTTTLTSGWEMKSDTGNLSGYYDDFEYRLSTTTASGNSGAATAIRNIYLTVKEVTK